MSSDSLHIHLATDHAGFALKQSVKDWLVAEGYEVVDHGAQSYDETDDFPDFIAEAGRALHNQPQDRAIVFGGSGQGEAMMANRFKGVRATVYYGGPTDIITLSRAHNDANALSIGARFVSDAEAKQAIWDWLHAPSPTEEKYLRRNQKLDTLS
jgi:ribose 5-phosphate isomerase B